MASRAGRVRRLIQWWDDVAEPDSGAARTAGRPGWWYRRRWWSFGVFGLGVVLVGVAAQLSGGAEVHHAFAFGGSPNRVRDLSGSIGVPQWRITIALAVDCVAALVYSAGLALVLRTWWRYGWRSVAQGRGRVAALVAATPLLAGACDLVENVTALATVRVDGAIVDVSPWGAHVGVAFGVAKWLFVTISLLLLALTLYGATKFRGISLYPLGPDTASSESGDDVGGRAVSVDAHNRKNPRTIDHESAVCLSGGGIRSAAFAWGALASLERNGRFAAFDRMYSVSGGGYAASAWSGASPKLREPAFFAVAERTAAVPETTGEHPQHGWDDARYAFVRERRCYLGNGYGGIVGGAVLVVVQLAVNLIAIAGGLFVLAVPIGLFARSRYGLVMPEFAGRRLAGADIDGAAVWVLLVPLVLAAAVVLASLSQRGAESRSTQRMAIVPVAIALAVVFVFVLVPWTAMQLPQLVSTSSWRAWWAAVPALIVWLVSFVAAVARPRLARAAIKFGGVVSTVAMFGGLLVFVRLVVTSTVSPDALIVSTRAWVVAICCVAALLGVFDFAGIQWWSLHPVYRNRLAGTFTLLQSGLRSGSGVRQQHHADWPTWSDLAARADIDDRIGPMHVVCAATHRRDTSVTGLRSISYTFSREGVRMHVPEIDGATGAVTVTTYARDADWLAGAVAPARRSRLLRYRKDAVISTAAMSGAAFNSAMGRYTQGSTDSLLAFLNLRLGVWLPNPRFDCERNGSRRFTRPGLRYLFNEVVGHFDVTDPFVHVSDGGHWENLGLVEALRDRHRRIVCIDASGGVVDPAYTDRPLRGFETLFEAIDLARIELHADVDFETDDLNAIRPSGRTGRSQRSWAIGTVRYHYDPEHDWAACTDQECPRGEVLYVKAMVNDRTPEWVLAHANTDRVFPDYPTGDQFLTKAEFRALVGLGESAIDHAIVSLGSDWWTAGASDDDGPINGARSSIAREIAGRTSGQVVDELTVIV